MGIIRVFPVYQFTVPAPTMRFIELISEKMQKKYLQISMPPHSNINTFLVIPAEDIYKKEFLRIENAVSGGFCRDE
jgi:hypothetical protein